VRLRNFAHARRLEYWRLVDGTIELDSVGVRDEGLENKSRQVEGGTSAV